jgi:flagellar basal-body rod protein FlgC
MFSALDISTSALAAQRIRMTAIAGNIANISTTHNELGEPEPYKPRYVVFQPDASVGSHGAKGVKVAAVRVETDRPPRYKYEPGHPDAIQSGPMKGYVAYPDLNMMTEMTDALEAARAYEANLGAIEITKDLTQQTLRILA